MKRILHFKNITFKSSYNWFKIDIHQQLQPLTANYLAMFKVTSTIRNVWTLSDGAYWNFLKCPKKKSKRRSKNCTSRSKHKNELKGRIQTRHKYHDAASQRRRSVRSQWDAECAAPQPLPVTRVSNRYAEVQVWYSRETDLCPPCRWAHPLQGVGPSPQVLT